MGVWNMNRSVAQCLLLVLAACAESVAREPIAAAPVTAPSRPDTVYMVCAHDRDGDGVPDVYDRCDLVKGDRAHDGCHDAVSDTVTDTRGFDYRPQHLERYAVRFAPGTSTLAPANAAELDRLVTAWRENSSSPIEVYVVLGPRDLASTAEARIGAVRDALAQREVTPAQITVSSPWCDATVSEGFVQLSVDLSPATGR